MKKIFFIITILLTSFKLLTSICIPNKNCLGERENASMIFANATMNFGH